MVISHSYVSLPEGKGIHITIYQPLQKNGPPALPAFEDVQWHGAGGNGVRKATRSPGGVPEPGKISNSRSYIFFNHFKSFNEHFLIFFLMLGWFGWKVHDFSSWRLGGNFPSQLRGGRRLICQFWYLWFLVDILQISIKIICIFR